MRSGREKQTVPETGRCCDPRPRTCIANVHSLGVESRAHVLAIADPDRQRVLFFLRSHHGGRGLPTRELTHQRLTPQVHGAGLARPGITLGDLVHQSAGLGQVWWAGSL